MPASGNSAWTAGAPITSAKLNALETAVSNGLDKRGDTATGRMTFAAGLTDGDSNADTSLLLSLGIPIDTRSWIVSSWSSAGKPAHIDIIDGATVVATIDVTYNNSTMRPTQVVVVAGGKTITYTVGWDSQNRPTGFTKVVA